jgi:general secretion pathway protein B
MSYILEALKKAEQARLAAKLPDIQSLALSSGEPVRERLAWLFGAVLVIALASAAATGWWFSAKAHEKPSPEKVAVIAALTPLTPIEAQAMREPLAKPDARDVDAAALAPSRSDDEAPRVRPISTPEQKAAPKRAEKPVATAAVESMDLKLSRSMRVLYLEELPPEVRRDVPKISATGYVYSADTGVRIVNVNERSLQEGDELLAGLKLEMIAPDHVLFSFRGYRFRVEMF